MLNVDTMKVYAPFERICKEWNPKTSRVTKNICITGNAEETKAPEETTYKINVSDIEGITSIDIKPLTDKITIELSSKILRENYYKHINKNTLEEAIDNINKALYGVLGINKLSFIDSSSIARLDVLSDIKQTETGRQLLYRILRRNPREGYYIQPEGKSSLIITSKAKSNNCRMTIYNKLEELITGRKKTLNLKLFDPYSHFIDTTRTELILRKRTYLRKYLNLEHYKRDIPLEAGIQAIAKPLTKYIHEFTEANQNPPLFDTLQEKLTRCKTLEEYEKTYGRHAIIREANYDIRIIRDQIRPYFNKSSNLARAVKRYKELITEERNLEGNEITLLENYITELEEKQ